MNIMSAIRVLPDLRKEHKTKPCNQKDVLAEYLVKSVYKLKNTDKASFYSPSGARATPARTSKSPVEREFALDSGASMHMLSKKELSSDELDTLQRSRNLTTVVTANEKCVVQSLEDTPAVL